MHEMSIALSILDIVKEEANKAKSKKVTEILLEVGTLSGVEVEALNFAMEACLTEPLVTNCKVKIQTTKAIAKCVDCNKEFEIENLYSMCPHCNSYSSDIVQGQEMRIKSITVD